MPPRSVLCNIYSVIKTQWRKNCFKRAYGVQHRTERETYKKEATCVVEKTDFELV